MVVCGVNTCAALTSRLLPLPCLAQILLQASIQPSPPRSRRLPQRLPGRRRLVAVAARKKEGAPEEELSQAHPTGSGEEGEVPSGPAAGEAPLEAGGEAPPAGEAQQAQHPGASSAPLMQEKVSWRALLPAVVCRPAAPRMHGCGRARMVVRLPLLCPCCPLIFCHHPHCLFHSTAA